jgi:hypothetical protein
VTAVEDVVRRLRATREAADAVELAKRPKRSNLPVSSLCG